MTGESTTYHSQKDSENVTMTTPRKATISYIRQFARAYSVISGVGLNQILLN